MTLWIAVALAVLIVIAAWRIARLRRQWRRQLLEELARTAGIAPTIAAGRSLGWIGEGDVRADGETVYIRLRPPRWRQLLSRRPPNTTPL